MVEVNYPLEHLRQEPGRVYLGPIQDDEALILYAIIRATGITRVLELGGLSGYSARNFLAAGAEITTAELSHGMTPVGDGHTVLSINCADVAAHVDGEFGMVFFDAHDFAAETKAFDTLVAGGQITADTVIAIHDTGWHTERLVPCELTDKGWLHNPPAQQLRDYMVARGCVEMYLPTFHGMSLLRWMS